MTNTAITAEIAAGANVPGVRPYRARVGRAISATQAIVAIAGRDFTTAIPDDAPHVTVKVSLEAGPTKMKATFLGDDGTRTGAYFAYVKKL